MSFNNYFDRSIFVNPALEYFRWLFVKIKYQLKYWGMHLRIGYKAVVSLCKFGKYNWIGPHCIVINSIFNDHTYVSHNCLVVNSTIGKFCSIGPNVKIGPGKHPTSKYVSTHPSTYSKASYLPKNFVNESKFQFFEKVEIGNDVWVGANVVILDGIKIADGAVIAANSVVTKNVNEFEIVGGVPAKYIKKRFDEVQIQLLKEIEWWNKGEKWIEANISKFWSIDDFLNEFKP